MTAPIFVRSVKEVMQVIESRVYKLQESNEQRITEVKFPCLMTVVTGTEVYTDEFVSIPVFIAISDVVDVLEDHSYLSEEVAGGIKARLKRDPPEAQEKFAADRTIFLAGVKDRVFTVRDPVSGEQLQDPVPKHPYRVKLRIGIFKELMGESVFHEIEGDHFGKRYEGGVWFMNFPKVKADGLICAPYYVTDDMVISYTYCQ